MRIYTINALLWQMAVFDALTMTSYAIYIMRFRLIDDENSIGFVISDLRMTMIFVILRRVDCFYSSRTSHFFCTAGLDIYFHCIFSFQMQGKHMIETIIQCIFAI